MATGTNYRVESAETLSALITAVDAVIAADPTWSCLGGAHYRKDGNQWVQALQKMG